MPNNFGAESLGRAGYAVLGPSAAAPARSIPAPVEVSPGIQGLEYTSSPALDSIRLYDLGDSILRTLTINDNTIYLSGVPASVPPSALATVAFTGSATDIGTGTLADARLSANVPLKNAANVFTNTNTFNSSSGVIVTGPNQSEYLRVQKTGMHFPVIFTAGMTDFNEGQIDNTIGLHFNLGRTSPIHPYYGENYEVHFQLPGGQRLIEKNWAYESIAGTRSYRPFMFNIDIDTHRNSVTWSDMDYWTIADWDTGVPFVRFDHNGVNAKRFLLNGYISSQGTLASSNGQPLVRLSAVNAGTKPDQMMWLTTPVNPNGRGVWVEATSTGSFTGFAATGYATDFTALYAEAQSDNANAQITIRPGAGGSSGLQLRGWGGGRQGWTLAHRWSDDALAFHVNGETSPSSLATPALSLSTAGALTTQGPIRSQGTVPELLMGSDGTGFRYQSSIVYGYHGPDEAFRILKTGSQTRMSIGTNWNVSTAGLTIARSLAIIPEGTFDTGVSIDYNSGFMRIQNATSLPVSFANAGFVQGVAGDTYVNAASGQAIELRIANGGRVNINANRTLINRLALQSDQWHWDSNNAERIYFWGSAQTILRGYGTQPIEFRNAANSTIGYYTDAGGWFFSGVLNPTDVNFPANKWLTSVGGEQRIYFTAIGTTISRGYGSTPHQFRNGTDGVLSQISSIGVLTTAAGISSIDISGGITTLSSSIAFGGNGHLALYSGGQIYLGDNNFRTSGYWNSAPGIGAVGSAPTSELAFYVYTGSVNSRTEAGRFKTNLGLQIGGTSGNILRSSGVSMLVRNSADNAYANIISQESYVQSFLNVQHPSLGSSQWYRAYASNGVTTNDCLIVDSANTGAEWRFLRNGGFYIGTSGAQLTMVTGGNTFTTFMGGPGNYEGYQHFQTNGQTNFWVHSSGTISRGIHYLMGTDVFLSAFDSGNAYVRFFGTGKSNTAVGAGSAVELVTNGGTRFYVTNTESVFTSGNVQIGTGGPRIKNNSGELLFRNSSDTDRAGIVAAYGNFSDVITASNGIKVSGTAGVQFSSATPVPTTGSIPWIQYTAGGNTLYLRDVTNTRMHVSFYPGANSASNGTHFHSRVLIDDAFIVSGGAGVVFSGTTPVVYGASAPWMMYSANSANTLYLRDVTNGRMHVTYVQGTTSNIATTTFSSQLIAQSSITTGSDAIGVGLYTQAIRQPGDGPLYIDSPGTTLGSIVFRVGASFVSALTLANDGSVKVGGATGPVLRNNASTLDIRNTGNTDWGQVNAAQYTIAGYSYGRVAQHASAGTWGGGYNFNLNGATGNRDSTGSVTGVWYSTSELRWYAEASGAPGTINPRMTLSPTLFSLNNAMEIFGTGAVNKFVVYNNATKDYVRFAVNSDTGEARFAGASGDLYIRPYGGATSIIGNYLTIASTYTDISFITNQGGSGTSPLTLRNSSCLFTTGVWHKDSNESERFYYLNAGGTFYKGNGTVPHTFRNGAGSDILYLNSDGTGQLLGHFTSGFQSLSADPSTLDISSGMSRLVKNTTSGEIRHWVNDGGVMKKSPAYT